MEKNKNSRGKIMSNIELLKKTGLFDGLSDEDIIKIASGCMEKEYPIGSVLIEENEPPKEMLFIVKEGEVAVSTSNVDADETENESTMLATFGPGEAVGEISLVDKNPHSATVRAMSDSKILLLPASYFYSLVEQDKNIGYVVMRNIATVMCNRLRTSNFAVKHFGLWGKTDD